MPIGNKVRFARISRSIQCAVLAVCGWEDSYSNSVPRLLTGLSSPKLAIMGPWTHSFPCRGDPGPRIGYLQEALRWWKHWLAGEDTGIMNEPLYRVWIHGEERPRPWYKDHAGSWAAEESWPSPRIDWQEFYLERDRPRTVGASPDGTCRCARPRRPERITAAGAAMAAIARSCHRSAPRRRPILVLRYRAA